MAVRPEKNKKKWTKDGRYWYFDVYYTDMYGKRKEKKSRYYKNKKEAKAAEKDFLKKVETVDETDTNILFSTVYDEWLKIENRRWKPTTFYNKKSRDNKYILNFFKEYKLHSVKTNIINLWYDNMDKFPCSLDYKNKIVGDLKSILSYAAEQYEFDKKVISIIQPYRVIEADDKPTDAEKNFWTYEQFKQFINSVNDDYDYYVYFNFLYYTGVRFGEFAALNWKDYDPINKTIKISKTLTNKVEGQKYIIMEPKSKNSKRIIDLDDDLNNLLKQYKKEQEKIYGFNEDMFMFGNVKYIAPTTFRRRLNKYIEKSKLEKRITPHGFRHSHVSLLIDLGCDSRDVAERIGDTVAEVEKTYYHMFPKKKKETVKKLNSLKK